MIAAYLAGATAKDSAALFGYSYAACFNALKRNGIKARSFSEVRRQRKIDETYFDQIDTEEKAYWLGFITADGAVSGKMLLLSQKVDDASHLEKFAASLQSDYPVKVRENSGFGKGHYQAYIHMTSARLVTALRRLGIDENKSFSVKPCQAIPSEYQPAYWRGMFDGDGGILHSPLSLPPWGLTLVGNYAMVSGFQEFIKQFVTSKATVIPCRTIFQIRYGGSKMPCAVAHVLYDNAIIYLDRKYELIQKLFQEVTL